MFRRVVKLGKCIIQNLEYISCFPSVSFDHVAIERHVKLLQCCPLVQCLICIAIDRRKNISYSLTSDIGGSYHEVCLSNGHSISIMSSVITSTKKQQENAEWTGSVIYVWCFIVPLSSGTPCIVMYSAASQGEMAISAMSLLAVVVSNDQVHSVQHPDRFWGPPSSLYNGYRGLFP
jgi:hypothetical protein